MEGSYVDDEEWRDLGALRESHRNWDGEAAGTWLNQGDGSV